MRPLLKQSRRFVLLTTLHFAILAFLPSCISIGQQDKVAPATYIFEVSAQNSAPVPSDNMAVTAIIVVNAPRTAAGYDTSLMAYMREPGKLEYFRDHRWADMPGRMLHPLLVSALEGTGSYQAVIMGPTVVKTNMHLETELLTLRQNFLNDGRSQIQLTLRLQLIAGGNVAATKLFTKTMDAIHPDPQSGAAAVNKALHELLPKAAGPCAAHTHSPREK